MVKSFSIDYIPISWTADYLQINYLKKNLDQEQFRYYMDGEIIFHILHTNFIDCRLFTNSLLEKEFGSRVDWV